MSETSSRLLELLSLLQGRRDWPGGELADRLEVSGRTIRRDVERLRRLGYPVESLSGPAGGYRLRAGSAMPPLLLDDDEAIAIAVGLRTAARASVTGIEETAVRALVKLEQVLPAHLRRRVARAGLGDLHPPRGRADRRPAAPDRHRRRLPRLGVPALRLPAPRRHRQPAGGRAPLARQPGPPLVPRRLGPPPRGLAHIPHRSPEQAGVHRRALPGAQAAGEGRERIRRAQHHGRADPLRGARHACRPRPTRSASASRTPGAPSSRWTGRRASSGPATTTCDGWRCASRCSAWTSRCSSRRSWPRSSGPWRHASSGRPASQDLDGVLLATSA